MKGKKILKINKRGVGIKVSRVEKFQKINNPGTGGGTIIRNLRVRLSHFEKVLITDSGARQSLKGKFLTDIFWGRHID